MGRTGYDCTTPGSDQLWYVHCVEPSLGDADSDTFDIAGWDPIFEYEGKTYAEMDKEAKV